MKRGNILQNLKKIPILPKKHYTNIIHNNHVTNVNLHVFTMYKIIDTLSNIVVQFKSLFKCSNKDMTYLVLI